MVVNIEIDMMQEQQLGKSIYKYFCKLLPPKQLLKRIVTLAISSAVVGFSVKSSVTVLINIIVIFIFH